MAGASGGGAETAFAEIVAAQREAGFDVHAACRPSVRNDMLREAGVPLTELPFGGPFDFKTTRALKKLTADIKPAVVVTWMNRAAKKLPKAALKAAGAAWVARLGGYYDLKYYRGVNHFIVNAPDIGAWVQAQGVPENDIAFIPNFAALPQNATPTPRAPLHTPDDAFLFLALSRLHTNKALDTLIAAAAQVPGAHVWIAGEGPERPALEGMIRDMGLENRVRLLGWREDRWNLLAACDAFVLPSRHEPFGNSFMQCWAAERPLITTASQGPSYYVRNDHDGLVTPIDDVPALAAAMKSLMDDAPLRARLARTGRERYAQAFDKSAILGQWHDLFERLSKAA